jgi:hypothetical protein
MGLECEYGDDPRVVCHTLTRCDATGWSVSAPVCDPLPMVMCPSTREEAAGSECTPNNAFCAYDGLSCRCTNCEFYPVVRCEGPLTWRCDAPNPDMPSRAAAAR